MTIKRRFTVSALTVVIIIMLLFEIIRIIMLTVDINNEISQKMGVVTEKTILMKTAGHYFTKTIRFTTDSLFDSSLS